MASIWYHDDIEGGNHESEVFSVEDIIAFSEDLVPFLSEVEFSSQIAHIEQFFVMFLKQTTELKRDEYRGEKYMYATGVTTASGHQTIDFLAKILHVRTALAVIKDNPNPVKITS